jgi:predicted metal-dependent peptidase
MTKQKTTKAEEKLSNAIIKLKKINSFWGYAAQFLKFKKAEGKELPITAGIGISSKGNLIFKEEFVNKLTQEECLGILCHEILHLALFHPNREKNRNHSEWNIACDLTTNSMLIKKGFCLPSGALAPQNNKFTLSRRYNQLVITDIDQKSPEEIYWEISTPKNQRKLNKFGGKTKNDKTTTKNNKKDPEGDGKISPNHPLSLPPSPNSALVKCNKNNNNLPLKSLPPSKKEVLSSIKQGNGGGDNGEQESHPV